MRIVIASDHAGFDYKEMIINHLHTKDFHIENLTIEDLGPFSKESFDYPDSAHAVANKLVQSQADFGILICGTGIGMCIAANRHIGIRAALCHDEFSARATRLHNDANVLCLGARITGESLALSIVDTFFASTFEGGRHIKRIEKIEKFL